METRLIIKNKLIMWLKIQELRAIGYSKSKISRVLEIHRDTVRHYLTMDEEEYYHWLERTHYRVKKLDKYGETIKNLLHLDPSLSSAAIQDKLQEKHELFPNVSQKTVYNYVEYIRKKYNIPKKEPPHIRQYARGIESDYGEKAQVDFGESWMVQRNGSRRKVYFMVMVLCKSRQKYYHFQSRPFTTESAIIAHDKAFSYFEGQPKNIIYDQDRVFLSGENLGDYILTKKFQSYVSQMDFKVVFCKARDPESKGMVENCVKYVKRNFLKARIYVDDNLLNEQSLSWLSRTGNGKPHAITKLIPNEEWEKEKPYLIPLKPAQCVETQAEGELRNVMKNNTIQYSGNCYSLPLGTYNGESTWVRINEENGRLLITDEWGTLIAEHPVSHLKGEFVRNTSHFRDRTLSLTKDKEALFKQYPQEILRVFIESFPSSKMRYIHDNIRVLKQKLERYDEPIWQSAIEYCIENKIFNAYTVIEVSQKLTTEKEQKRLVQCNTVSIKSSSTKEISNLTPATSNINTYTNILNQ